MSVHRAVFVLAIINLLTVVLFAVAGGVLNAAPAPAVLRAQLIELVDSRGTVRAQLRTEADGAVVFRLTDQRGQIRVKLGAGEEGSGLLLADETSEVGVHLLSGISGLTGQRDTKLVLAAPNGASTVLRPGETTPAR